MTSKDMSGATTVVVGRGPRWGAVVITLFAGAVLITWLIVDRYLLVRPPAWAKHLPAQAVNVYLASSGVAVIWGCSRSWLMGLRMDSNGVRVRNYFRTYRIRWPDVRCFADGSAGGMWALSILLHGGGAVTASSTAKSEPSAEMLAEISQGAERHGIAAELTGTPAEYRGPKWRSVLPGLIILILTVLFIASLAAIPGTFSDSCPCS